MLRSAKRRRKWSRNDPLVLKAESLRRAMRRHVLQMRATIDYAEELRRWISADHDFRALGRSNESSTTE